MRAEGEVAETQDDSSRKKRKAVVDGLAPPAPKVTKTVATDPSQELAAKVDHHQPHLNLTSTTAMTEHAATAEPIGANSVPKPRHGVRSRKAVAPTSWEYFYFRLGVFKQKHGHCRVPSTISSSSGKHRKDPLSQWVLQQRSKQGIAALTEDQRAALDALGFVWAPRDDDFNRQWDERFAQLLAYKEKHRTTIVPVKEETGLGKWVATQRDAHSLYLKKQSGQLQQNIASGKLKAPKKSRIMSEEHFLKLKSIDFTFSIYKSGGGWEGKYAELKEYKTQHGDCKVPQHWKENKGLGKFVARQRYLYCMRQQGKLDNNPLTQERIDRLNLLGFHWGSTRPNRWKDIKLTTE